MSAHHKTALVVGATGVVGTKLVEELQSQGDWLKKAGPEGQAIVDAYRK